VLSFGARRPERFDVAHRRWIAVRLIRARAHAVTIRLDLGRASGALFRMRRPVPAGPIGAEAVFGRVRSGVGRWYLVDSHGVPYELRTAAWSECPSGLRSVGAKVQSDGFWLCARRDLAARRFYVGNVAGGVVRYYRVRSGRVKRLPTPRASGCPGRSRLVARLSGPDGFWLCLSA
jgi:hypothetical protein